MFGKLKLRVKTKLVIDCSILEIRSKLNQYLATKVDNRHFLLCWHCNILILIQRIDASLAAAAPSQESFSNCFVIVHLELLTTSITHESSL